VKTVKRISLFSGKGLVAGVRVSKLGILKILRYKLIYKLMVVVIILELLVLRTLYQSAQQKCLQLTNS
jgi:hypothetical protein